MATRNNSDEMRINRTKVARKQKWEEKQLLGHFKQLTSDISQEDMGMAKKWETSGEKLNVF